MGYTIPPDHHGPLPEQNMKNGSVSPVPPLRPKYNHAEAFCLMWYKCESCPHCERIWNSRDGVTPFGTSCPSCSGSMYHMMRGMVHAPQHKLRHGQKFWRTMTEKDLDSLRTKGHFRDMDDARWRKFHQAQLEEIARGAPWLDVCVEIGGT